MKRTSTVIIGAMCISLAAFAVTAQSSRANEGISRQVTAIKNMLDSFADTIRPRVQDLEDGLSDAESDISDNAAAIRRLRTDVNGIEDDVDDLETRENRRTACNNRRGNPSIHWPRHPEANSSGCVSHEDIATETTSSGRGCGQQTVSWEGRYGNRTITCRARTIPTPHGIISSTTDPYGGECQGDTNYGTAYVLCNNGSYELQSNSRCNYNSNGLYNGSCR